jgi:limonene-1,2-epoxide hydrolase
MDKPVRDVTRRVFLATAGAGAAAASFPRSAEAQQTDEERANVKVVNDFCATFSVPFDWDKTTSFLSSDCKYRASQDTPIVEGPDAIVGFLDSFANQATSAEFEVVDTWARGPVVVNDRVDRFRLPEQSFDVPVVGVFHVVGGKIVEWSDFVFDVNV